MKANNNNQVWGKEIENKALTFLNGLGFWTFFITPSALGQPCDIIAIKHNTHYLIDVKALKSKYFTLNRIEPNQQLAFKYASEYFNIPCLFLIFFNDTFKVLEYNKIDFKNKKEYKFEELDYAINFFK